MKSAEKHFEPLQNKNPRKNQWSNLPETSYQV